MTRHTRKYVGITGFVLLLVLFSNEASMANNDLAKELRDLGANKILLMTLPAFMAVRGRMNDIRREASSCVYELSPGSSFDEVVETLGSLVVQTDKPKQERDLRVGII